MMQQIKNQVKSAAEFAWCLVGFARMAASFFAVAMWDMVLEFLRTSCPQCEQHTLYRVPLSWLDPSARGSLNTGFLMPYLTVCGNPKCGYDKIVYPDAQEFIPWQK